MSSSKSDKSNPLSSVSGISLRNSSNISRSSSPERFRINLINPILISGSEIKHNTPFGPQLAAKIFPPLNSEVTISKSPNSKFFPCSSLAQKNTLICVKQNHLRLLLRQFHLHLLESKKI